MDKLVLTDTGGFPLKLDDLLWMDGRLDSANKGMYDAIQAHLLAYGTDFIVEGCVYSAPNITAGWIMLDSELMRVDAAAGTDDYFERTVTFDARGSKTFKDTSVNNTYEKIRGVLSGASGSLNVTTALRLEDKQVQLLATSAQQFAVANIPDLPASKTTSGTFDAARIPNLDASKVTTGTFAAARIPSLDASKITTGQFTAARIPDLDAAKITTGTFVAARLPDASQSAKGIQENANTSEAQALSSTTLTITPSTLSDVTGGLLTKVIDIGDWNMDSTNAVVVNHGLDATKIRSVTGLLRDDTAFQRYPIPFPQVSGNIDVDIANVSSTAVGLFRRTSGAFDGTDFDATSYNRGWLIIQYVN